MTVVKELDCTVSNYDSVEVSWIVFLTDVSPTKRGKMGSIKIRKTVEKIHPKS